MSTVVVIIDGREVRVPAGTGLVEAAAELAIEVPVFCYEPRIGPAVGACRMCMVEIEGMPKLQTACSTSVRDGMVVSTVSGRARDAQEAVLEFLLINHPLDCPVCDKGGECPLQDQAFRWGPGASRFNELKRNNDKPVPISPLIGLDRERCILCYRCTRFSAEVSEDKQLIPRQRGANSIIATFEGKPYADRFSGNIVELCPVGALTSTEYRFKARPWEAPNHPTVCALCPVGCNINATVREGQVVRVLSRENTAVDEGWLCDRGRFSYSSLYSHARVDVPEVRPDRARPAGNRQPIAVSFETAIEWLYDKLSTGAKTQWILSGTETNEEVWAMQQIAAATGGRVVSVPGGSSIAPRHGRQATLADVVAAKTIVVVGDADLADIAPIVDLRVRKAMRAGARVIAVGIGGSRLEPAGAEHVFAGPHAYAAEVAGIEVGEGATVVIAADGAIDEATLATLVEPFGLNNDGSGVLPIPAAANARGLGALGVPSMSLEEITSFNGGMVLVNVDPSRIWTDDVWRPAFKDADWQATVGVIHNSLHAVSDLLIPGTSALEKDGTIVNLEGRIQRLSVGAAPPEGVRNEIAWLSSLARRFDVIIPSYAAGAYRELAAGNTALPARIHGDIPPEGLLGSSGAPESIAPGTWGVQFEGGTGEFTLYVAPFLYDAADVEHADSMEFLLESTYITLARDDAKKLGVVRGDTVCVKAHGWSCTGKVAISRRLAVGYIRAFAGAPGVPGWARGYTAADVEPVREPAVGVVDR